MSGKNQFPAPFVWFAANPSASLLPLNNNTQAQGSPTAGGVINGPMSGTNTIYSNILDVSRLDNDGLEIAWTGTPTGTISYWASVSGISANFFQITLTTNQPAGSPGAFGVNLNQYPYKYLQIQYVNSSGSGNISVYGQYKDLN
jgi:hypothetical protein